MMENHGDDLVDINDYLLEAAMLCSYERVQELLNSGANVNFQDEHGISPLYMACSWFDDLRFEVIQLLIENGADVTVKSNNGESLLNVACRATGDLRIAKLLIENGADVFNDKDNNGATLLHGACCKGRFAISKFLIDCHAENGDCVKSIVNARDNKGWTPLHEACYMGTSLELIELLLNRGANVSAETPDGSTPLHLASEQLHATARGHWAISKFLIDYYDDEKNGGDCCVKKIVNAKGHNGWTPLHQACYHGRLEVVQLFVKNGANVKAETTTTSSEEGSTPLCLASKQNHSNVVWFLLRTFPWLIDEIVVDHQHLLQVLVG